MRFYGERLVLTFMFAFATHGFALTIHVGTGRAASRDLDMPKRQAVSFTHVDNEVMAPQGVALVRHVSWTYKKSGSCTQSLLSSLTSPQTRPCCSPSLRRNACRPSTALRSPTD